MISDSEMIAIAADVVREHSSYTITGSRFIRMINEYDLAVHRRAKDNRLKHEQKMREEIDNAKLRIP